ncbi:unnamed protein product [Caenorhabditis sp. 36 PRJEB53466]|nr:unnamed protein product [Caenorhabditis sp. 36 PRJEB53466]
MVSIGVRSTRRSSQTKKPALMFCSSLKSLYRRLRSFNFSRFWDSIMEEQVAMTKSRDIIYSNNGATGPLIVYG